MASDGEHADRVVIDASVEHMPAGLVAEYGASSEGIAYNHGRFPALQQEHVQHSRDAIIGTARVALEQSPPGEQRRALLLGAGACHDIPLTEIVDMFDHTVLAEADVAATERALSKLVPSQLAKVSLVGADVTGMMAQLASKINKVGEGSPTYDIFVTRASALLRSLDPAQVAKPDLGREYAFVCSHLVLSQLCTVPYDYMRAGVQSKFGRRLPHDDTSGSDGLLVHAMHDLSEAVQVDHMRQLADLVHPAGAVHFADTYSVMDTRGLEPRQYSMFRRDALQSTMDERFRAIAPITNWVWQNMFVVVSNALAPRTGSKG